MKEEGKETEGARHEYTEVNTYLRHYSSLRFVMFSVFFAVMAGIISVALGVVGVRASSPNIILTIKLGGWLTTIVFSMYEFRLQRLIRHYQKSAENLEKRLGYSQMTERPKSNLTFIATWIMYIILFLFWIFVMWKA